MARMFNGEGGLFRHRQKVVVMKSGTGFDEKWDCHARTIGVE